MILDTNAVSALAERDKKLLKVISESDSLALSFIAHAEFRYGLLGSSRPDAGKKLLEALARTIPLLLPDSETIEHYAWIADQLKRNGRPIPTNDLWIAALARQHTLPILSQDRHFDHIPNITRRSW